MTNGTNDKNMNSENIENSNIPTGWVETTLGEVAKIKGGKRTPKGHNLVGYKTSHPYIRITDIENNKINENKLQFIKDDTFSYISNYIVQENDVIVSIVGTIGLVSIINKNLNNANLTENCAKIIVSENLYYKFLYYFLISNKGQSEILKNTVGAVQKKLPIYGVSNLSINLPPIEEQRAIAGVLSSFDDKIELLREQNKTLEALAQTIFHENFGKYKPSDDLPPGWHLGKLGEIVADSIGGDYGKEVPDDKFKIQTICLRGTDLPDMKAGVAKKAPIRFVKGEKIEKCKLKNGDIVIEISGGTEGQSTGRSMYVNNEILNRSEMPMTCVNFCRIVRPIDIKITYFLYSYLEYLYKLGVFFNLENGSTGIKNLNLNALLNSYEVILPPLNDMINFNTLATDIFKKVQCNNTQIESLEKTRDGLLPKLISGKVRVNQF